MGFFEYDDAGHSFFEFDESDEELELPPWATLGAVWPQERGG